jgi:hypothetical protein
VVEENRNLDQIYNADETGLRQKGLSVRTLAFEREKFSCISHIKNILPSCTVEMQVETTK